VNLVVFRQLVAAILVGFVLLGSTNLEAQVRRPLLDGPPPDSKQRYGAFLDPIALTPPKAKESKPDEGNLPFYLGEKWRYQNMTVFGRFWASLLGTTINFVQWDEKDWMWFGLTVGGTLAFMAPTNPSPDAQLQFWIQRGRNDVLDGVFWRLTSERFSAFGLGFVGISALAGWLGGWPDILEWASLMFETLGLVQFHGVTQKLLIGRESPYQGNGYGVVHGPTQGYKLFPSGTPSGHTASVFAITTLTMDFFDEVWIDVLGYTLYAYISMSVLYNNQHFISDVIWGAPLGYFLGKWVMKHRSSKYQYIDGKALPKKDIEFIGLTPFGDPNTGATGLTATWTW